MLKTLIFTNTQKFLIEAIDLKSPIFNFLTTLYYNLTYQNLKGNFYKKNSQLTEKTII